MEYLCVRLENLSDEILVIILQKLNNCDVLYSFIGLNKRFDKILYDRIFTRNLSLIKSIHRSSCQFNIILDLCEFKPEIAGYITPDNISIFIRICILFNNLRYLNFSSYSNYEQLAFLSTIPSQFSSNLLELHVVVKSIFDCLCLLDGQFNQLHTFYVTIQSRNGYEGDLVKQLPNLKYFSLIHEDRTYVYDNILIPLFQRMTNLEELYLHFITIHGTIIDGDNLKNNIINHITRLNKFTFNIRSVIRLNQCTIER
ncbi:hypothetical protein I4U23_017572 [Adineta vaga]|nr:hypothetical protein I4U23_017572 [Adineta vaga]